MSAARKDDVEREDVTLTSLSLSLPPHRPDHRIQLEKRENDIQSEENVW